MASLPTARELMVPLEAYPHVDEHCSLAEALTVLAGAHIEMHGETSLPRILLVFEGDTLVGLIRRRDILQGLSPRWFFRPRTEHPEDWFDVGVDQNISEILADKAISRFRDRAHLAIDEFVQPIAGVVAAEDGLIRLVSIMVEKGYHMLPVIEDEHVIGVVRSVEVLAAVAATLDAGAVTGD